jgi:hypothetical protein
VSNANKPMGFIPHSYLNGAPWNGQCRTYNVVASYATALYVGDPVITSGTADGNGVQGVAIGAGTGPLLGVIVGIGKYEGGSFNPSNLDITYRPASDAKTWYVKVVDDPAVLFEIQEESGTVQLAATDVGANTISVLAAGNGFVSGWQLACYTTAAPTTTNTLQLRLHGLVRRPNNAFGAYAKWLVSINVHELGHGPGAAGI